MAGLAGQPKIDVEDLSDFRGLEKCMYSIYTHFLVDFLGL